MKKEFVSGNFKRAFKCSKCPQQSGENGCPLWWEILYTNIQTGEEILKCGCGFVLMPLLLLETLKSGNHAAEAAYRFREDMTKAMAMAIKKVKELSLGTAEGISRKALD